MSVVVSEARMVLVGRGLSETDVLWVSAETDHGYVQGSWAEWEHNTDPKDTYVSFTRLHIVGDGWWLMWSGAGDRWIYIEPPIYRPDAATWAGYAMRAKIEENKRRFEQRRELLPTRPHDLPPGVHVLRVESCSTPILHNGSQILAVEFTVLASRTHARGARCRWAARSDEAADFVAACSGDFLRWSQETTLLIGKLAGSVVRAEGVQGISAPAPVHFSWSPASDPEQP